MALTAVLAAALVRLWLMPLPSSFWADEAGTVFVARYGAARVETAVSIYFPLVRAAAALGGSSEVVYRLPSTLAMLAALLLCARLAARLIHPQAAWFAAFACMTEHAFNFQAADARPYALGTAVMAAALWFEVRWLDRARRRDAVLFFLFAALLLPIHPLYWPFLLVFGGYALARFACQDTPVTRLGAAVVFAALAVAVIPVPLAELRLARDAREHVIVPEPGAKSLLRSLVPSLVLGCWAGAWLLSRIFRGAAASPRPARSSLALVALWWLCPPVALFAMSHLTGISVFVGRYYSLALPGAALAGTALAARFLPSRLWKPVALFLGIAVLLVRGDWRELWPPHADDDWRGAALAINQLAGPATPVLCPSPFVEAQPPGWYPGYPLVSFAYSTQVVYPIRGRVVPLPFSAPPTDEFFAAAVPRRDLAAAGRFFVYGHQINALFWEDWCRGQPETAGWTMRRLGPFGHVIVAEFERPVRE